MQTSRNSDVDATATAPAPDADADAGNIRLELMDERARADQLATTLVSNHRIGIAVGLVMAQRRCSDIESFAVLRQASMDTNRRLADVAEDVTGLRRLASPPRSRRRRYPPAWTGPAQTGRRRARPLPPRWSPRGLPMR
ncbi:MAG: ANTAR domain-containing protein [Actinomycetota bacterium]|nr:ANTAR domain-containing protein [Actinomycetota bacterium]